MKYNEFKIEVPSIYVDDIVDVLISMEIYSIEINDPNDIKEIMDNKEKYAWDYIDDKLKNTEKKDAAITIYFDRDDKNFNECVKDIRLTLDNRFSNEKHKFVYTQKVVDDNDWKYNWKKYFKPLKITEKLVVKPTWEEYIAKDGEHIIEIDPEMAFGTGSHETTSLCLKLMEKYILKREEASLRNKILDIGCGSGILAIGAALLGAEEVLGVEIDKDAIRVAKKNVELNNVEKQVKIKTGDLAQGLEYKADIVVANLMADLVIMLSSSVKAHLETDGVFISSGILLTKKELVCNTLIAEGFEVIEVLEDGEWCAIVAKVKDE